MGMTREAMFTRPTQLAEDMMLAGFDSGESVVDKWLRERAGEAKRNGSAVVYVSHRNGADVSCEPPAGFYTLSSASVARDSVAGGWLKRNAPRQIPVILMGMLGVDARFQGQGLGKMLLHDAAIRSLAVSDSIGAKALVVDPLDESLGQFYEKFGFKRIPGSTRMFAPLKRSQG